MKGKFICIECGHKVTKWHGKCPDCNSWNSIEEVATHFNKSTVKKKWKSINNIVLPEEDRIKLENQRGLNRVFGNGLEKASVNLISGAPGVGKSTLLLLIIESILNSSDGKILYGTSEETIEQLYKRIKRLSVSTDNLCVIETRNWEDVLEAANQIKPKVIILDSIQMFTSSEVQSPVGSPNQIKHITENLIDYCKNNKVISFLIGHVTKTGSIAGPMHLEHMVDAVFYFEKTLDDNYRELRPKKNRFSTVNDMVLFTMNEKGLVEANVDTKENNNNKIGSCVSYYSDGRRVLPLEIEVLAADGTNQIGNRICNELSVNKISLLIAVMKKYLNIDLDYKDLYLKLRSLTKVNDDSVDLSIIVSILSSIRNMKVPNGYLFLGEVSLSGDVLPLRNQEEVLKRFKASAMKYLCANVREGGDSIRSIKKLGELNRLFN